jgi:hypothetical protein
VPLYLQLQAQALHHLQLLQLQCQQQCRLLASLLLPFAGQQSMLLQQGLAASHPSPPPAAAAAAADMAQLQQVYIGI